MLTAAVSVSVLSYCVCPLAKTAVVLKVGDVLSVLYNVQCTERKAIGKCV